MQVILELSLYPLTRDYDRSILDFIDRLRAHSDLDISTGETATVVRGTYDNVFAMLEKECRDLLDGNDRVALVMKLLNTA